MAPVVHSYDPPDRFVVGTVGQPGERVFFLQARSGRRLTSVVLEKEQVRILGERIGELLDELAANLRDRYIPRTPPEEFVDAGPLDQPIEEEFRAGTITLSWDTRDDRVVIEVFPRSDEPAQPPLNADEEALLDLPLDEPEPGEVLLVRMSPGMARAFASRAEWVVSAGRPTCMFCGGPVDPSGHLCPRANGYRRSDGQR